MSKSAPTVSIIIPARNEAGTIRRIVEELPSLGSTTEIIFIENGSTDTTLQEIQNIETWYKGSKEIRFVSLNCKNKAEAVRIGFTMAKGNILMIYDADMTVPSEELKNFLQPLLNRKSQLVNGTRFVYPMEKKAMPTLNYIGNKIYSFITSWLSGQKITDTLCGTKALWKEDYEEIEYMRKELKNLDPFCDFDLLLGAINKNYTIVEVPVHYKARIYGKTNMKAIKHGWLYFKVLFLFFMKKYLTGFGNYS